MIGSKGTIIKGAIIAYDFWATTIVKAKNIVRLTKFDLGSFILNMISNIKDKHKYKYGGLSEVVAHPSELTFKYLEKWFSGVSSYGKAMDFVNLPYFKIEEPILVLHDGELLVDATVERKLSLGNSKFPLLSILKIIKIQFSWVLKPNNCLEQATKWISEIPNTSKVKTLEEVERTLENEVLPRVIALGIYTEFFHTLTKCTLADTKNDWVFKSIADQKLVQDGKMTLETYLEEYGFRADDDYELTCPRWYEIKEEIKQRIANFKQPSTKEIFIMPKNILEETYIKLSVLRSEAKKKTLPYFDLLRKLTNANNATKAVATPKVKISKNIKKGKGRGVSKGTAMGVAKHIKNNLVKIEDNTIGIFPNASVEFGIQFPKCKGLIFQKGGMTSHGAIVAREFGIPALIDEKCMGIQEESMININGDHGEWEIG